MNTFFKFILIKYMTLFNLIFKFINRDNKCLFFFVIVFNFLKFTYIYNSFDFLKMNKIDYLVCDLKYRI